MRRRSEFIDGMILGVVICGAILIGCLLVIGLVNP